MFILYLPFLKRNDWVHHWSVGLPVWVLLSRHGRCSLKPRLRLVYANGFLTPASINRSLFRRTSSFI